MSWNSCDESSSSIFYLSMAFSLESDETTLFDKFHKFVVGTIRRRNLHGIEKVIGLLITLGEGKILRRCARDKGGI